ncbi:MAG: DsbA family protein [Anaerolineales bacterium]|jgi:protein-disulfide isomerase
MSEQTEIQTNSPTDNVNQDFVRMKRSHLYAMLLPLAFVAGLASGFIFWGRDDEAARTAANNGGVEPAVVQETNQQGQPARFDIDLDDDPALGPEDAPIVIVEFSDFRCPYCRRFHEETFPALMEAYPDQIKFVYRDFPVVGGVEASQASECADEQDAFWEYHDLLFSGGLELGTNAYLTYAEDLGLDMDEFNACMDEERYADEVEADARYAASLGANGTPTFFINGIPLVGAQPLVNFQQIIDAELE